MALRTRRRVRSGVAATRRPRPPRLALEPPRTYDVRRLQVRSPQATRTARPLGAVAHGRGRLGPHRVARDGRAHGGGPGRRITGGRPAAHHLRGQRRALHCLRTLSASTQPAAAVDRLARRRARRPQRAAVCRLLPSITPDGRGPLPADDPRRPPPSPRGRAGGGRPACAPDKSQSLQPRSAVAGRSARVARAQHRAIRRTRRGRHPAHRWQPALRHAAAWCLGAARRAHPIA